MLVTHQRGIEVMSTPRNGKPLHLQLEEVIRERITSEWEPGSPIPSENELSRQFGVSRSTARSVLTQLVGEGLIYRIPGKGTFVSEAKIQTKGNAYACIRDQLEQKGYEIFTRIDSLAEVPASKRVAEALQLVEGDRVYEIRKVRFVQKEPMSLHVSYFPGYLFDRFLEQDFTSGRLCEMLEEKYGIVNGRVSETLESCVANFNEAELLRVLPGHPLLLLWNLNYSRDGVPYEFSKILFRGDRIQLSFDYGEPSVTC